MLRPAPGPRPAAGLPAKPLGPPACQLSCESPAAERGRPKLRAPRRTERSAELLKLDPDFQNLPEAAMRSSIFLQGWAKTSVGFLQEHFTLQGRTFTTVAPSSLIR